jgi:hypothetical protein
VVISIHFLWTATFLLILIQIKDTLKSLKTLAAPLLIIFYHIIPLFIRLRQSLWKCLASVSINVQQGVAFACRE